MRQKNAQIREKSFLGHFCHHFLNIKGNSKEGKVHFDLVKSEVKEELVLRAYLKVIPRLRKFL